jgi:hypothetical protein
MRRLMLLFVLLLATPVYADSGYCLLPTPNGPGKCDLWYFEATQPNTTADKNRWRCPTYQTFEVYYTTPPSAPWFFHVWQWTTREEGGHKAYRIDGVNLRACRVDRAFKRYDCFFRACLGLRTFASCNTAAFQYPPPNC